MNKLFAILFSIFLNAPTSWGHSYHTCLIDGALNTETGTIEVILTANTVDLVKLTRRNGIKVLKKNDKVAEIILNYLKDNFEVEMADQSATLKWYDMKINGRKTDLLFELIFDQKVERLRDLSVSNKIFFDINHDQINTMVFYDPELGEDSGYTSKKERKAATVFFKQ